MSSKYQYSKLSDVDKEGDNINFYGVIVDATLPYKTQSKYVCTLKVIDPTLYLTEKDKDCKSCASVIIYAK